MPPRGVLVALSVSLVLWPLVARALGSVIGTYTMFSHIERYHLDLAVVTPDGNEAVTLRSLAPHLSLDARRTLLPADGYAAGADQADIVAGGLLDLARLLCDVRPNASAAHVRLLRGKLRYDTELRPIQVDLPCEQSR